MDVKDRGARRDRLRSRAVTTTVVATVVAAPVLALWAAYRGAPLTGESDGATISAADRDGDSVAAGQAVRERRAGPLTRSRRPPEAASRQGRRLP